MLGERVLVRHFGNLSEALAHKRILDYEAGFGLLALALARRGSQVFVYDSDPRRAGSLVAAGRVTLAPLRIAHAVDGELEAGAYDLVLCGGLLDRAEDDFATLRRLHRMLRPKGALLLSNATHEDWIAGGPAARYTRESVRARLIEAGFVPRWEREGDRWSGLLKWHDLDARTARLRRLRRLRLSAGPTALALVPATLVEWSEENWLPEVPYQKLVTLCQRGD